MKRYAVYYAPRPGPFARAAAHWLGRDPASGQSCAQPSLTGLPRPLAELTEAPRRYGFHGTLKPPFRLAEGTDAEGLRAALDTLAAGLAPISMDGLALRNLGGFLALMPEGDLSALNALAAAVVERLEPFRAPLNPAEIARRRPERLSARQRALLERFGYPYVMEEFHFHLTLSDALGAEEAAMLAPLAEAHFGPVLPRPFPVQDLCLFGEDEAGGFHLLHRAALAG